MRYNLTCKPRLIGKLKTILLSYKLIHLTILYICILQKHVLYIELCL